MNGTTARTGYDTGLWYTEAARAALVVPTMSHSGQNPDIHYPPHGALACRTV